MTRDHASRFFAGRGVGTTGHTKGAMRAPSAHRRSNLPEEVQEKLKAADARMRQLRRQDEIRLGALAQTNGSVRRLLDMLTREERDAILLTLGETDVDLVDAVTSLGLALLPDHQKTLILRRLNLFIDGVQRRAGYDPIEDRLPDLTGRRPFSTQRSDLRQALKLR